MCAIHYIFRFELHMQFEGIHGEMETVTEPCIVAFLLFSCWSSKLWMCSLGHSSE